MTYEQILGLALFALSSSITPGPNNLMLMASGANFGFRRSLPHQLGVGAGFVALLILTGLGLAQIFNSVPYSRAVLKMLATLYLLWLAWKIANAGPASAQSSAAPMTFWQAAAFQWVNPKGWAMALTANSVYVPEGAPTLVLFAALIFGAINLPSVMTWTLMGQQIARVLRRPGLLRGFNLSMAVLLVLSLYPILMA